MSEAFIRNIKKVASKLPVGKHRMESTHGALIVTVHADSSIEIDPLFAPVSGTPGMPFQFDRVVVINRPDRKDRRVALETHLREIAWPFKNPIWHSATPGELLTPPKWWKSTANTWGNLQSHLQVIREARDSGAETVLVMEDDCLYLPDFLRRTARFLSLVPEQWGMLLLGGRAGIPNPPIERIHSDFWRVAGWNNLESYAVHRRAMGRVIETLESTTEHSDVALQGIQWEIGTFHMNPPIAVQRAGWSDNFGKSKDEKHARVSVNESEGAVIFSSGAKRRHLLANSTASFRRNNPRLGLKLISDRAWAGYDCDVVPEATGFDSRSIKTRILSSPPFRLGVVLDDDTITLERIPSVESVLGEFDIALAPDAIGTVGGILGSSKESVMEWVGDDEAAFMREHYGHLHASTHWNTGVMFFRDTEAVRELSRVWHEEWSRFKRIDQMAFCRAVDKTGIRVGPLHPSLHRVCATMEVVPRGTRIAHLTAGKWFLPEWLAKNGVPEVSLPSEVRGGCCGGRSVARMAKDLRSVISGAARDALKGEKVIVSDEALELRKQICGACDRKIGNRCGECGCFLSLAQPLARKLCPMGKWEKAGC